MTPEEKKKEYNRLYHLKNNEKRNEYNRLYYIKNKEKSKEYNREYRLNNKENNKEYHKEYSKTEKGKKSMTISKWKTNGVICEDFNKLHNIEMTNVRILIKSCKFIHRNPIIQN